MAPTTSACRRARASRRSLGLERAPSTWATVEVDVEGFILTDADTGLQRSPRKAVRWKFNGLGNRMIKVVARNASGTVVDTRTRTLFVR